MKLNSVSEASDDLDALMAEAGVNLKSRANPRGASLRAGAIAAQVGAAVKEQENALKRRQVCMIHSFLFLFTSRTIVQKRKQHRKKSHEQGSERMSVASKRGVYHGGPGGPWPPPNCRVRDSVAPKIQKK